MNAKNETFIISSSSEVDLRRSVDRATNDLPDGASYRLHFAVTGIHPAAWTYHVLIEVTTPKAEIRL